MAWIYLVAAGLCEVAWAVGMKYTQGFTKLWPSAWTATAMVASVVLLAQALKAIPVGTGYAIWTGIGAIGTAIFGIFLFSESAAPARLVSMALILAGIAGLKLTSLR
jgi:quaternary ammonium compound-resistance protein SugE